MNSIVKKNKYIVFIAVVFIVQLVLFSCSKSIEESSPNDNISVEMDATDAFDKSSYKYYDLFDISPVEIIVPKNQTNSQSLSVVITDNNGNLIVFDGGRKEDANFLCDIIKDHGGKVRYWYLTHIHDDHIGALYSILSEKRTDIDIGTIVYSFASFEWYYSKMGNDAGILLLFEKALNDYNEYVDNNHLDKHIGYIRNSFDHKERVYNLSYEDNGIKKNDIKVIILNNRYELDQDPINNTSITYLVQIKNRVQMLIFGDLGFEGGFRWLDDIDANKDINKNIFDVDIITLAHHGQNGVDPELYKRFNPKVVIWPTSKDIYENKKGAYYTDDTKKVLSEISGIEYQIKTYEETAVIR